MSLKEDALSKLAPGALSMVAEITANISPENEVAQFIDENIGILSKSREDDGSDVAFSLLQKISVSEANKDPEFSLQKLLEFYEQFRTFYVDYTSTPEAPTRLPKDEGEGHPGHIDSDVEVKEYDTTKPETAMSDIKAGTMTTEPTEDDATDPE